MTLNTPITSITAVGKRIAPALKKLGLHTAGDLLLYFPYKYEDWSKIVPISQVIPGEPVTIRGRVDIIHNKRSQWKKRLITEALLRDTTGTITIIWFYQPYLTKNISPGDELYIAGSAINNNGRLQFNHPLYEKITPHKQSTTHTARIIPLYSLTHRVTQKQLRYIISKALPLARALTEWLPPDICSRYNLPPLNRAIHSIHFPSSHTLCERAQHRFKFEELFLINLRAQLNRIQLQSRKTTKIIFNNIETKKFVRQLPFTLTTAQRKAAWTIITDMQKNQPMNRLIQGDVGSGKTIVAVIGMLNALLSPYQVAYMAPTELLAAQQFETLSEMLKKFSITLALFTGSTRRLSTQQHVNVSRKKMLDYIKKGTAQLVVGTHALASESVEYAHLSLAIVDEQHRFGVKQRAALTQKIVPTPHFLSMTATPMPRSLALTLYGDLDITVIDEMPTGRKPVKTKLVPPGKRSEYYRFIYQEVKKGRQVFVICPLVDPSDILGNKAATEEYEKLRSYIFKELRIGLVHGKMKAKEKELALRSFADHKTDILVATPVIEVGINIPNATVMMIESAERFGLAQLHQFRGRVGRGNHQSYCFLFTESESRTSLDRLYALVESNDGFALAEKDLTFRGPGEVYGIKQHGFDDILNVATLTDYLIIQEVQQAVQHVLALSPRLSKFPAIIQKLKQFEQTIHLE